MYVQCFVCLVFTISVFIKFHISCRLQTYQLLKHANYYNKLLISSLMINDSNNGWQMTNSKIKSDSLKLVSLNVGGLSNFRKCRVIFTWCRKQKADLIFLQETHSTKAGEYKWKKDWGSEIIFSHGSSNARGVAVLIKRGVVLLLSRNFQIPMAGQ